MDQQEWFADFGKVSARFGHTVASKAIKQDEDIQSQQWEGFAVTKECASVPGTLAQLFMNISMYSKLSIFTINKKKGVHEK